MLLGLGGAGIAGTRVLYRQVQWRRALLVPQSRICAVVEQGTDCRCGACADRAVQRSHATLVARIGVGARRDQVLDDRPTRRRGRNGELSDRQRIGGPARRGRSLAWCRSSALLHWRKVAAGGEGGGMISRRCRPVPEVPRSAFKGFRFRPEIVVLAVRWYLRVRTLLPRCRRAPGRAWDRGRSRHGVPVGAALHAAAR